MRKAICMVPVEIYDAGARGLYKPGDVIEGEAAELLLARYPAYFEEEN